MPWNMIHAHQLDADCCIAKLGTAEFQQVRLWEINGIVVLVKNRILMVQAYTVPKSTRFVQMPIFYEKLNRVGALSIIIEMKRISMKISSSWQEQIGTPCWNSKGGFPWTRGDLPFIIFARIRFRRLMRCRTRLKFASSKVDEYWC